MQSLPVLGRVPLPRLWALGAPQRCCTSVGVGEGVGEGLHAEDPRCHQYHLQGQAQGPRSVVPSLEQVQGGGQAQAVPWDSTASCC